VGGQAYDLGTVQCLEKWLKAAPNLAMQPAAVDLDIGDPRRQRYFSRGRRADEGHVDSVVR